MLHNSAAAYPMLLRPPSIYAMNIRAGGIRCNEDRDTILFVNQKYRMHFFYFPGFHIGEHPE